MLPFPAMLSVKVMALCCCTGTLDQQASGLLPSHQCQHLALACSLCQHQHRTLSCELGKPAKQSEDEDRPAEVGLIEDLTEVGDGDDTRRGPQRCEVA